MNTHARKILATGLTVVTGLPRRMSCEREYHPGDGRWQTTWTIRE